MWDATTIMPIRTVIELVESFTAMITSQSSMPGFDLDAMWAQYHPLFETVTSNFTISYNMQYTDTVKFINAYKDKYSHPYTRMLFEYVLILGNCGVGVVSAYLTLSEIMRLVFLHTYMDSRPSWRLDEVPSIQWLRLVKPADLRRISWEFPFSI
jgi:hypothetical protein